MTSSEGLVVCLGEVLMDQVVDVHGHRQKFPGGAPANVAVALARLGVQTAFVGAVGNDADGAALTRTLQAYGVDCRGLQVGDAPTRVVEVRCTAAGDRVFGGFMGGSTAAFADAQLAASALPGSLLQSASVLITGTLGLAYPATRAALQTAADMVQAGGGQLVIDVNWRPTFWPDPSQAIATIRPWLARADLIKVAVDEAIALFQTADLAQLAATFPQAHLVLTDGARGCQYRFGEQVGQVPAFAVPVVETTGAGDAFLAGLVAQWRQQAWQFEAAPQIRRAVQLASAMGALTTLQPGAIAAQPTRAALQQFLQSQTDEGWAIETI